MCLIIQTKKEIPLSKELLTEFYNRNDDGFGFMYIKDNKMRVYKTPDGKTEDLIAKYEELKEYEPYIHLRMKTHGLIDHENTHPYYCGYGIWLMHNGVLSSGNSADTNKSDTWHFIDRVIKPIFDWSTNPHKTLRSDRFKRLIETLIGSSNRFVIGDRGGFIVFNETSWHKITEEKTGAKDLLVSNSYAWSESKFRPTPAVTYQTSQPYGTAASFYRREQGDLQVIDDEGLYLVDPEGNFWERMPSGCFCRCISEIDKQKATKSQRKAMKVAEKWAERDNKKAQLAIPFGFEGFKEPIQPAKKTTPDRVEVDPKKQMVVLTDKDLENDYEDDMGIVTRIPAIVTPPPPVNLTHYTRTFTEDEYVDELIREYCKYPNAINTFCFSEPQDAARVIRHLLKKELNV